MNRTKVREIGKVKYCIYCAEKSKRDHEGSLHNNDYVEFDVCNCTNSRKALTIKQQIDDLYIAIEDLPRIHEYKLNKMQFDLELDALRKKYNVPKNFNNPEDK